MSRTDHERVVGRLVRKSSLDPAYAIKNMTPLNKPVKLDFKSDLGSMTQNWSVAEKEAERRLVRFWFQRVSSHEYAVELKPISTDQYDHSKPIISCIFWREKDLHVVTSVDIILILEFLVQESFSIEEKNRIRRNLQSLTTMTVSRSNKQYQRFFNLLMSMEDPRPRNIEQDLKVFRWVDLFKAINKVISKYSALEDGRCKGQSRGESRADRVAQPPAMSVGDSLPLPEANPSDSTVTESSTDSNDKNVFLPNERLRVLKRKINQAPPFKAKRNRLFSHALKPSEPVPIQEMVNSSSDGDADGEQNSESPEDKSPKEEHNTNTSEMAAPLVPAKTIEPKIDDSTVSVGSDSSESQSGHNTAMSNTNSGASTESVSRVSAPVFSKTGGSSDHTAASSGVSSAGSFRKNRMHPQQSHQSHQQQQSQQHQQHQPSGSGSTPTHKPQYYQYPAASSFIRDDTKRTSPKLSTANVKQHDWEEGERERKNVLPSIDHILTPLKNSGSLPGPNAIDKWNMRVKRNEGDMEDYPNREYSYYQDQKN